MELRPTALLQRLDGQMAAAIISSALLSVMAIVASVALFNLRAFNVVGNQQPLNLQPQRVLRLLEGQNVQLRLQIQSSLGQQEVVLPQQASNLIRPLLEGQSAGAAPPWLVQGLVMGMVVAVTLSLLSAYAISRRIARPIKTVSAAATRMGQGDLSARATLTANHAAETVALAQNFNHMAEALERSEQQRRELIADIAHELRTPLGVISSRLEALEDELIPFDRAEASKLKGHAELLARLIEDLRTLSLADTAQLQIYPHRFDLAASLRRWISSLEPRAAQLGQTLHLDAPAQLWIEADEDRIAQVVANLLQNALRHTPAGGGIWVRAAQDQQIELSVCDSGPGIPADHRERIFERFHRVDPSRSRSSGGSGLGLSIARALTELHGGRISVDNGPQGGAVFTLWLPTS